MNVSTLRDAIWDQLLEVEKAFRYYGELSDRYRRWHAAPRYLMLASSLTGALIGAASILGFDWGIGVDGVYISTLGVYLSALLLVIAAVLWDLMHDFGQKTTMSYSISDDCEHIGTKLRYLWRQTDTESHVDSEALSRQLREIDMDLGRITARAGYANIGVDKDLNERAEREAYAVVSESLATNGETREANQ